MWTPTRLRQFAMAGAAGVLALATTVLLPVGGLPPASAATDCGSAPNPVACENALPGTSGWQDAEDSSIEGFTTAISTNQGGTVTFKINTNSNRYHIDIFRQGWYGGVGARRVATVAPSVALPQNQPNCLNDAATGLIDCGNWSASAQWVVPAAAVSGVYRAVLVRDDGGQTNHIFFVVRADASHSDLLVQTSDTTWQAYNAWGGNSFYQGAPGTNPSRAYKVSYNRPSARGQYFDDFETAEISFVRWVERNGYDVSYLSGVDTDRSGSLLLNHKTFLSVGHDEYWSGTQRANVEAARDAGINLAFLSGNEVYWKTRWEPGADGADHRTLVSYKESFSSTRLDPTGIWTGTWQDPRNAGGNPSNSLTGTLFAMNAMRYDPLVVTTAYAPLRLWRGIGAVTDTYPSGLLGIEWDNAPDNGKQPPGLIRFSSSTFSSTDQFVTDQAGAGVATGAGTATHSLTMYRAASGALVFGAGTIQWSWGLDAMHSRATMPTDARIQQATVNLFADMGAQPATIQSDLAPAAPSTDTTPASVAFTSPAAGSTVQVGAPISVTGTASDVGGAVAAVEISTDGGSTWHPATPGSSGFGSWSYGWTPTTQGSVTLLARATDDSANLGTAVSRSVNVGARTCPCTLFGSTTPTNPTTPDTSSVELGVTFSSSVSGSITGVRFYKGDTTNGGTHTGRLWSSAGALLASATFVNESSSGWQTVSFSSPVAVTAGATYVASYVAPQGRYAGDAGFFASPFASAPLTATGSVYRYGSGGVFPTTASTTNYWVDVVFSTASVTSACSDTSNCTLFGSRVPSIPATTDANSIVLGVRFSSSVDGSVTGVRFYKGDASNGGTHLGRLWTASGALLASATFTDTASGWQTVSFASPVPIKAGTTYVASYSAPQGHYAGDYRFFSSAWTSGPLTATAGSYRYGASTGFPGATSMNSYAADVVFAASSTAPTCPASSPCTVFGSSTPSNPSYPDANAVEVGVAFSSTVDGWVTGVRFYKGGSSNSGTHTGHLWSSSGALLATATFTSETSSGWQFAAFSSPVAIKAGTTYVASYYAPQGSYAADVGFFASPFVRSPLTATAGAYVYGSGGTFPAASSTANYWVDVRFTTG